jgi:hypothetical protein
MTRVAALFVAPRGCYFGLPDVDPWTEDRDARTYAGQHPIVGHPPCQRWGRYWFGRPGGERYEKGDDDGCFASCLANVRRVGGVIEHPAGSYAWTAHGLAEPRPGGWFADLFGGWSCLVEQGHYGHRARKPTWLYAVRCDLPSLRWGRSLATVREEVAEDETRQRGRRSRSDAIELMGHRERLATPLPFRDMLLAMARSAAAR